MSIVVLKLPVVKRKKEERPGRCRYCAGTTFQRWGAVQKRIIDVVVKTVKVYRYRCCGCNRTFRYYPEGITRADQSERLKQYTTIFWSLCTQPNTAARVFNGFRKHVYDSRQRGELSGWIWA